MTNPVKIELSAKRMPACFTAFDILYLDGNQITGLPLMERKALLSETVRETPSIAVSRVIEQKGSALYKIAEEMGLEVLLPRKKTANIIAANVRKIGLK